METVQTLVRELVILAILAVLLELLLPESDMRRYVRMVLGLLVIVSVLQAVTGYWGNPWGMDFEVLSIENEAVRTSSDILRDGKNLWEQNQALVEDHYKTGLAKQIKALTRLNPEIEVTDVDVKIAKGSQGGAFGNIEEIIINIDRAQPGGDELAVSGEVGPAVQPEVADRLKETVADFYNLQAEQVKILYR
ncbi:MAG: stage III sporulation protein AF [Peptococcaceae bacterium]|nr:stage III sporulation protein AF [Peptococcaceae bacterium]